MEVFIDTAPGDHIALFIRYTVDTSLALLNTFAQCFVCTEQLFGVISEVRNVSSIINPQAIGDLIY